MRLALFTLIAFSVHLAAALTLGGPDSISACRTFGFSFQDGSPPYIFHPMLGAGAVGEVVGAVEQGYFYTNDTTYYLYINYTPGSVLEFYATDATNAESNRLWFTVGDSGSCPSSTSAGNATTSPPATITAPQATTTYRSSSYSTYEISSGSSYNDGYSTTRDVYTVTATSPHTSTGVVVASPTSVESSARATFSLSSSAVAVVVGVVLAVLLLAGGICFWRWRRARRVRNTPRRDQSEKVMMDIDHNNSGLLLTAQSPSYGNMPSTPNSASYAAPATPLAAHLLPSSKELRMRGAVNRDQDLEDGMSMSDISGPMSSAHSTSIWPENSDISHQQRQTPSISNNQQSLQALIGRELENILQTPRNQSSPTSFADTPSPLSSINDLQTTITSESAQTPNPFSEKPPLSLIIPQPHRDARSILPSSTTPISRRDMEVLADLVAQRLIRDRGVQSPTLDHNSALPPPSYS